MSSFCATKIMNVNLVYTPDQAETFQSFLSSLSTSLTQTAEQGTFNDPSKKRELIKLSDAFGKASHDAQQPFKPTGTLRHNLYRLPLGFVMNIPSPSFEGGVIFPFSRYQTTQSRTNSLCTAMARCRILATQQQRAGMNLSGGRNNVIGKLARFENALREGMPHNPTYFDLYPATL